jgi:hypothetical protein
VEAYSPRLPDAYNSRSTELGSSRTRKLDNKSSHIISSYHHKSSLKKKKTRQNGEHIELRIGCILTNFLGIFRTRGKSWAKPELRKADVVCPDGDKAREWECGETGKKAKTTQHAGGKSVDEKSLTMITGRILR